MRSDPVLRAMCWWLAAVLALCWSIPAHAKPASKERVVVRSFSGPGAARVRAAVVQALGKSKRYEIVPNDRVEQTAQEIDADLSTDAGRAAVSSRLELAGIVSGTIAKRRKQLVLTLEVYGGGSGTMTEERTFRARKPAALVGQVKRRLLAELRRKPLKLEAPDAAPEPELAVTESEPEPDAEPEAEEPEAEPASTKADEDDDDEAAAEDDDERDQPSGEDAEHATALELGLGVRFATRSFTYEQPETHLPEHSVALTPAGQAQLRWYPAAPFSEGFASHLGIDAYGRLMVPVEAIDGPSIYETTSHAFGVNLRARIPLWPSELGVHAGWGAHAIEISDSQFGGDPEVPSVAYSFLRLGADARISLSSEFALSLRASYLVLLGFGELAEDSWFPDASGGGIEAQLGAAYELVGPLWIEADLGLVRYFLSMNVAPLDPSVAAIQRVAEGASDQQLFATLGLSLRL
jgi:hypothetical protein